MFDFLNDTTPFDTTGTDNESNIFDVIGGRAPIRGEVDVKIPTGTIIAIAAAVLVVGVVLIKTIAKAKKG